MQTVYPATLSWRDFSTYSRHIISDYWRDYWRNHATPVREEKSERRQYTDADQLAVLLQACEGFQGSVGTMGTRTMANYGDRTMGTHLFCTGVGESRLRLRLSGTFSVSIGEGRPSFFKYERGFEWQASGLLSAGLMITAYGQGESL